MSWVLSVAGSSHGRAASGASLGNELAAVHSLSVEDPSPEKIVLLRLNLEVLRLATPVLELAAVLSLQKARGVFIDVDLFFYSLGRSHRVCHEIGFIVGLVHKRVLGAIGLHLVNLHRAVGGVLFDKVVHIHGVACGRRKLQLQVRRLDRAANLTYFASVRTLCYKVFGVVGHNTAQYQRLLVYHFRGHRVTYRRNSRWAFSSLFG